MDKNEQTEALKEAYYLAEERECSLRAVQRSLKHAKKILKTNITKPKKKRKK